jgi:hypothetical protein
LRDYRERNTSQLARKEAVGHYDFAALVRDSTVTDSLSEGFDDEFDLRDHLH